MPCDHRLALEPQHEMGARQQGLESRPHAGLETAGRRACIEEAEQVVHLAGGQGPPIGLPAQPGKYAARAGAGFVRRGRATGEVADGLLVLRAVSDAGTAGCRDPGPVRRPRPGGAPGSRPGARANAAQVGETARRNSGRPGDRGESTTRERRDRGWRAHRDRDRPPPEREGATPPCSRVCSLMHDEHYKHLFAFPRMVEDLLRGFVRGDWIDAVDFSTLDKLSAEYVSDESRVRLGDARLARPAPRCLAARPGAAGVPVHGPARRRRRHAGRPDAASNLRAARRNRPEPTPARLPRRT